MIFKSLIIKGKDYFRSNANHGYDGMVCGYKISEHHCNSTLTMLASKVFF